MPWILARVDAQPGDHLVDRFTFAMGLELNEYRTVVERTEKPPPADPTLATAGSRMMASSSPGSRRVGAPEPLPA